MYIGTLKEITTHLNFALSTCTVAFANRKFFIASIDLRPFVFLVYWFVSRKVLLQKENSNNLPHFKRLFYILFN